MGGWGLRAFLSSIRLFCVNGIEDLLLRKRLFGTKRLGESMGRSKGDGVQRKQGGRRMVWVCGKLLEKNGKL